MITYEELYELLRKEKHGEQLQSLSPDFVKKFSDYLCEHKKKISRSGDFFSDDILREKKEYENSMTIFNELMLRRKKKILNLVFVAAETGIMKKDFQDMLDFEQDLFDKLVRAVDTADKLVEKSLNNCSLEDASKKVLVKEDVEQFVDMSGDVVGPYKKGEEVVLDSRVADVLVSGGKVEVA